MTAITEEMKPAIAVAAVAAVNSEDVAKVYSDASVNARDEKPQILLVKRGATGTVKWFSFKSGYGFITVDSNGGPDDEGEKDIFVHSSSILTFRNVNCVLHDGERVEFDIIQGPKGIEAVAVTGEGGVKAGTARFQRSGTSTNRRRSSSAGEKLRNLRIKDGDEQPAAKTDNNGDNGNNKGQIDAAASASTAPDDDKKEGARPANKKRKNNRGRKGTNRSKGVSAATSAVPSAVTEPEQQKAQ